ncbi:MAG: MFS transporter [Ignavibacteriales bacterium]|nr:MFS transporter [Ignavibacteriales bacterium]
MNGNAPSRKPIWRKTFAALKHRNYRFWFWGQMVSLFGTWMQTTAQGFLIYQVTHSSAYLGYVGFAYGVPSWFFMLYGGVVADRVSRRKLLIITQSIMMILAFVLSALVFTDTVRAWHILVLAFGLGLANAFDAPARQAFVSELVDREDLTNAVALNATMFNTALVIGPALAGIIYAAFGPGWCFAVNGISFIAVIIALTSMHLLPPAETSQHSSTLSALKEGINYVRHQPTILALIGLVATTSIFGMSLGTLLPAWSVKILHGNAATNGLLFSARGVGSLFGALTIATLGRSHIRGKFITFGSLCFPVFIIFFALTYWLPLSLLFMVFVGIAMIFVVNFSNATIQTIVPDSLRGRVMGVYTTVFMGSMPLGALLLGTIAEHAGEAEAALLGAGVAFFIACLVWFLIPKVRAIE